MYKLEMDLSSSSFTKTNYIFMIDEDENVGNIKDI